MIILSHNLSYALLPYLPHPPPLTFFLLPSLYQPKRVENAKILIANTPMDTDKIKIYGNLPPL